VRCFVDQLQVSVSTLQFTPTPSRRAKTSQHPATNWTSHRPTADQVPLQVITQARTVLRRWRWALCSTRTAPHSLSTTLFHLQDPSKPDKHPSSLEATEKMTLIPGDLFERSVNFVGNSQALKCGREKLGVLFGCYVSGKMSNGMFFLLNWILKTMYRRSYPCYLSKDWWNCVELSCFYRSVTCCGWWHMPCYYAIYVLLCWQKLALLPYFMRFSHRNPWSEEIAPKIV